MTSNQSKSRRWWWLAATLTLVVVFFDHPEGRWIIVLCGGIFVCLLLTFRDYPPRGTDGFQKFTRWICLAILLLAGVSVWGYIWWPRLTVSPRQVKFEGYPNETFNFSVKNGTPDDVYDVQIPFLIGYGKHWDDKLSAKVEPNGDPPQRIYDDYNYCYGKGPDVHKIMPNEQEVLIVRLRHLPPLGIGNFSITYTGGEKFETAPGTPNFTLEPYSYSPMQATIGVRGDYRICKYAISTDGLVDK